VVSARERADNGDSLRVHCVLPVREPATDSNVQAAAGPESQHDRQHSPCADKLGAETTTPARERNVAFTSSPTAGHKCTDKSIAAKIGFTRCSAIAAFDPRYVTRFIHKYNTETTQEAKGGGVGKCMQHCVQILSSSEPSTITTSLLD
jgi:hypothetical protein